MRGAEREQRLTALKSETVKLLDLGLRRSAWSGPAPLADVSSAVSQSASSDCWPVRSRDAAFRAAVEAQALSARMPRRSL